MEAGCDETGRGCLAGPVVAAAVILPKNYQNQLLTDSKQLTEKKRIKLEKEIKTKALAWAIAEASHQEIDEINILNASFLAMHRAIDKLNEKPQLLLIDGNRFNPYPTVPHECIIKGDSTYLSIAAASVLAKNYRDRIMEQLGEDYPSYGWNTNVGYPTPGHREAIREVGLSPWHRLSFRQLPGQLHLFKSY